MNSTHDYCIEDELLYCLLPPQTACLLQHMNDLGVRDGVNKKLEQYVDGMPPDIHLQKLAQIRGLAN